MNQDSIKSELIDDEIAKIQRFYRKLEKKLQAAYGYQNNQEKNEIDNFIPGKKWKSEIVISRLIKVLKK